jgi:predicted phage terminase large subunit-like protein
MRCYAAADLALSVGKGDYSVVLCIGIDTQGRMHLVDLFRKQADPKEVVEKMLDMIARWKIAFFAHERIHIVQSLGPYIETRMRARNIWCQQELFAARGDKATRSASIRGKMELNGGLFVPAGAPWVKDFINELLSFPDGANDDCVDALSLCGLLMDKWQPGVRPVRTKSMELLDPAWVPYKEGDEAMRSAGSSIKLL